MNTQDQGVLFQCVVLTCFLVYPTVNSQSACGGTLTSLAGAIQSPNFPNNYTNGLSCIYVIKPNSKGITLTFTSFDLEHESACGYDYVEVRAGDSESSPKLGRYCGMSLPGPLRTSGNRMWVKFVTGSSVTRRGFRAIYTPACGATLTSLTDVIQSPNFPKKYPNGLGCVYIISVPDTYRVTLTFTNFDVENSTGCKYDYVEIRDGDSESSPRLGQYCGTSLPGPLRTSGNRMWIKFVTGSRVTRPGFRANYTSACGATLTSLTGVIQSPNFPNNYPNRLGCLYVISVPDTYRVTLTFTNFDVENSNDCKYDYVEVRDGDSESSPRMGQYCGTSLPGPLRTSGNRMWIKFVTGSRVTRPGFRANYTSETGPTALNVPLIGGVVAGVIVVVIVVVVFVFMKRRDTLYCKQEKKHPEESPATVLGAPYKQAAFTNQASDENVDPVYSSAEDENGGYDSISSVHANLESDDGYLPPLTIQPTLPRKPPTIPPR